MQLSSAAAVACVPIWNTNKQRLSSQKIHLMQHKQRVRVRARSLHSRALIHVLSFVCLFALLYTMENQTRSLEMEECYVNIAHRQRLPPNYRCHHHGAAWCIHACRSLAPSRFHGKQVTSSGVHVTVAYGQPFSCFLLREP